MIEQRPVVAPEFWLGVRNVILIEAAFVGFGLGLYKLLLWLA